LTLERLERLKNQIAAKKAEYDELDALSEKDLWCKDLDGIAEEWEVQLKLDDEISTGIKRMGRRASHKIGAGRGRKPKALDDEYNPTKKAARQPKPPAVVKPEVKSQQRFMEKFTAAKPKPAAAPLDDLSDDDFALLGKKPAIKQEVKEESVPPASATDSLPARAKRATAAKTKIVIDSDDSDEDFMELGKPSAVSRASESASASASEGPAKPAKRTAAPKAKSLYVDDIESESDASNMLGDVGAMVKGIGGAGPSSGNNGRLSLFAMSRPEAGDVPLPKLKQKASKANLDFDSHDDTNYEALAMSSPRKSVKADEIDDFLSDDDLPPVTKAAPVPRATSQTATSKAKAPLSVASAAPMVKKRGRPAGIKNKPKDGAAAPKTAATKKVAALKTKPVQLSPAAKAYAAKQAKSRKILSDDEEDEDTEEPEPVVKSKARPGRAAAAKAKPIVIDDDDTMDIDDKDEDSGDAFGMDDSE